MTQPFRVPIENVLLPRNVVAGLNPYVLMSLAYMLRATTEDPEPIEVHATHGGLWRVCNGRHRFLAAVMAGRPDVLCTEETG